MRVWILRLLAVAFVWFLVSRFAQIERLTPALLHGRWEWIVVAAGIQVLYYLVFAAMYQSAFTTVGVRAGGWNLVPVVLSSLAVSVATPAAGFGGAALFVDDAVQRGQPAGRAAVGMVLAFAADLTAFMLVLVPGLMVLAIYHDLRSYEVVAATILGMVVVGLAGVLLVGLWRPGWVRGLLHWIEMVVERVSRWVRLRSPLGLYWADRTTEEFTQAAAAIAANPKGLGRTIGIALGAHMLDLASLYALFLAFHTAIGIGTLVAGYAMGILFWNVSITPQGIGVVEGVMSLVYSSLGVPAEHATVTVLAFRGLTFWLPMLLGFVLLRRLRSFAPTVETATTLWNVRAVAVLTGSMAIVNLLSAVTPPLPDRFVVVRSLSPLAVRHGAHATAALAGFALLLLAIGLWRRKRVAWVLTLLVLVVSVISHFVKGLDYEEALLAALLGGWLIILRSHFHARSDPASVGQGLWAVGSALAFTLVYGTIGFYLLDRHFTVRFGLGPAVGQTIVMFTEFYDPGLQPITGFGRYFADSIYLVGVATVGSGLVMLLRPVLLRASATPGERARAREIVEHFGRSSLARFALFDDKAYYFSRGGSLVAYALKGRVAVALGDPIGPVADAFAAIEGFRAYCEGNDWEAAFYQTLPDYLDHYRAAGFHALHIGNEGIVMLDTFTLEGKSGKTLRGAVNRLARTGHRAILHEPPLPDLLLEELRLVSGEWLTMMHGAEKGFSLGWFDDDYIRESPVMAVHTADDRVAAFANVVPEYQRNEATIDLMRRRRDTESGTMDFLFVRLLEWAKERGYASFNLGLSPLAGVGKQSSDPAIARAMHYVYEHVNQFYNFKGLHAFKEKFRPHWFPRYLVYASSASLPVVAVAVILADSGDLFIWDRVRNLWRRRFSG